jgi:hypothetical protein
METASLTHSAQTLNLSSLFHRLPGAKPELLRESERMHMITAIPRNFRKQRKTRQGAT